MDHIPTQVILLAIFAVIVVVAILMRAKISLRVKDWFDLDAKPAAPTSVDVGKEINVAQGKIGEAIGVREAAPGREIDKVTVLDHANAQGATIDRLVGIEQTGDGTKKEQ